MAYDWTGAGGSGDYFGHADYARALSSGKSIQDVRNFIAQNPGAIRAGSAPVADLVNTIKTGKLTSSLGEYHADSGRRTDKNEVIPGMTDQSQSHFGAIDFLHAKAAGHGAEAISDYMKDSPMSIGAQDQLGFVHTRANEIRDFRAQREAEAQSRADADRRHREQMEQMRQAAEKARLAAEAEARKVKISGSTQVRGDRGPRSIRIRSSGIGLEAGRGTAQLSRTADKTRTLNIA